MFQRSKESAYLESTSLLVTVIQWRKPLLIITILAVLLSFIFSGPYFIQPKYESSVIFFPTSTNSISRALLENNTSDKQDILAYGAEEQAEQIIQILNSDDIRNAIIEKYNLMQHYGIEQASSFPMTELYKCFNDNISFKRTEFLSVRIDVMDVDPQMAADIANDIAAQLDTMKTKIQSARAYSALMIVEKQYNQKLSSVQTIQDSLKMLAKMGVMDYRNQLNILNVEYAKSSSAFNNQTASLTELQKYREESDSSIINTKARIKGAESEIKNLEPKINALANYGGASESMSENLSSQRIELNKLKEQYDKLKVDVEQNLPHKFIINKAVKAEKKSYPMRWLIVLVAVGCSFILSLLIILIIERGKEAQYRL